MFSKVAKVEPVIEKAESVETSSNQESFEQVDQNEHSEYSERGETCNEKGQQTEDTSDKPDVKLDTKRDAFDLNIHFPLPPIEKRDSRYSYLTRFYNNTCRYSGAAITILYYIQNNPEFYQQSFGSQASSLALPCITGMLFGKIITPVATIALAIKNYF